MALIRSISGIRATLGNDLLPRMIADHTAAFAQVQPEGAIVVGRDGRPSGEWMERIVAGTLSAMGREVHVLGMCPTPTVQLHSERAGIAGGISITASHNPKEWNGLKFLNSDGTFLTAEQNAMLFAVADTQKFAFITEQSGGAIQYDQSALTYHIENIKQLPMFQDATRNLMQCLKQRAFTVVVDAVNSSGSEILPRLLEELGCHVIRVHCAGTGVFPHVAEPLPEHLGDLCDAVREHKADMGFAVDPDADRLVLIDEKGNAIWEEYTITLAVLSACVFAETFGAQYEKKAVVNLSTTRAVEDILHQFGGTVERSAVGEINVVQTMRAINALIGGEGSGGVVLPASHAGRDSLVGAVLVLALCGERDQPLSRIVAELPRYAMVKNKVEFQGDVQVILRAVAEQFPQAEKNWSDGVRLSFDAERAWVHLRASNTEPIMRVISEAPDQAHAVALAEQCMQIVRSFL